MVATGYEYGAPPVVHADTPKDSPLDKRERQKFTPRLEMNEIFFGDTFGEPLDLLNDLHIEQEEVA